MTKLEKILIIDDSPMMQTLMKTSLASRGDFEVALCDDGAHAVHTALSFKPDLIIMDITMPMLSGPDALKALQRYDRLKNIPVIFCTGENANNRPKTLPDGAIGLLTKPIKPKQFTDTLFSLWDEFIAS